MTYLSFGFVLKCSSINSVIFSIPSANFPGFPSVGDSGFTYPTGKSSVTRASLASSNFSFLSSTPSGL